MKNEEYEVLEIDDTYQPILTEYECAEFKPIIQDFIRDYAKNSNKPVEEWLRNKMQESLPDKSPEEIQKMTDGIITSAKTFEEKKKSLNKAVSSGRSKESWLASELKQATSAMSAQEAADYVSSLSSALNSANEALKVTVATQAGNVSQNPSLDGFIAEQYHAQTFNMKAKMAGSPYRAEVLEPKGSGYAKNSVDIVIKDGNGNTVSRYQSKYCKNAEATAKAFEKGDYRGQQKLVPDGQQADIKKKSTNVIEAPDGVKSNPLSKSRAEQMRDGSNVEGMSRLSTLLSVWSVGGWAVQIGHLLIYQCIIVAYCGILGIILKRQETIAAAIPILSLGSLVCAPVFIRLATYLPIFGVLEKLFPATYYLML